MSEHAGMLDDSVQKIIKVLLGKVEIVSIFGSYAHGKSDMFTDLDIMIVAKTEKNFVDRASEIYPLLNHPVDVDIQTVCQHTCKDLYKASSFTSGGIGQ